MPPSAPSGAKPTSPPQPPQPRDELLAALKGVVQESDPHRTLDSIEVVAVRAYLSRRGVEHPGGDRLPDTINGWVEWVVHCSPAS